MVNFQTEIKNTCTGEPVASQSEASKAMRGFILLTVGN